MKKFSDFICKNKNIVLIISFVLLALSFVGMKLTKINYDILVYLPSDIETIEGQDILTNEFNMGAYALVVAENVDKEGILELENQIKKIEGVNKVGSIVDVVGTSVPLDMLPKSITKYLVSDESTLLLVTFNGSTSSEETIDAVDELRNISENLSVGGMSSMVLDTMNLSNSEITILETRKIVNGILDEHTGKSIEEINEATSFDNYMNAKEAIEFGICDAITKQIKVA